MRKWDSILGGIYGDRKRIAKENRGNRWKDGFLFSIWKEIWRIFEIGQDSFSQRSAVTAKPFVTSK
jgi:hypothetical protein